MTIDWTQPVETTEDPPRPVRVLATDCDGDYPIAVLLSREPRLFTKDGFEWLDADGLALRNVAPPKPEPVLREAWVWWNSHGKATLSLNEGWCVHQRTVERGVYAHVAVMSDGSPVPGEAAGEDAALARGLMQVEINRLNALLTEARTKAEALNRDLDSRIAECGSAWEKCDAWRTKAEALQAEIDEWKSEWEIRRQYELMKPVVDEAVAWADRVDETAHPEFLAPKGRRLYDTVRTYQQTPKKTAAEAVSNVAAMMGAVKNCTTATLKTDNATRQTRGSGATNGSPAMTDYGDLIQRLISEANDTKCMLGHASSLHTAAADAIEKLVAERDDAERLAFDIDGSRRLLEGRLALAEADLAAARAALRKSMEYLGLLHQFMCDAHKCDFNEDRTNSWIAYMAHEVSKFSHDEKTIAAARAEGGE